MSNWINVAKVGEIAPGEHRLVDADGTQIAIFNLAGNRRGQTDLYLFR